MITIFALLGWKAEGFRCPDHSVSLIGEGGLPAPLTLIQMPNGTGKTTTLNLLRAALSGEALLWSDKEIRDLQKKESAGDIGTFQVDAQVGDKRLTVVLNLLFAEGRVQYKTTFASGVAHDFLPPVVLRRFLTPGFVRLFVFDGEQAERLLDARYTNAEDAIDSLYQLKFFGAMQARCEDYWKSKTQGAKQNKGLTRARNRVEKVETALEECVRLRDAARIRRDEIHKKLQARSKNFQETIKGRTEYGTRLQQATVTLTEATEAARLQLRALHTIVRDPHALSPAIANTIVRFRENLDKAKLPESTAKEFFLELAGLDECVCGRPLDDSTREHIRNQSDKFLASDDVALLNAIKGEVTASLGPVPESHFGDLSNRIQLLRQAIRAESESRTSKEALESEAASQDPGLERIHEEIKELQRDLDDLDDQLDAFEGDDSSPDTVSIVVLEKQLKYAETKLADVTHTLELKRKRDILVSILQSALTIARKSIGDATVTEANSRVTDLMPDNAIKIKGVDGCLLLEGQEGGSVGETLSVAYAFLSTFFNGAEHKFPFVVDSPAGPIDLKIRPKIAELVPKLTHQFVAFTISSERQGFSDSLPSTVQNSTRYLTVFRKGSADVSEDVLAANAVVETCDGVLVDGKKFFEAFQKEEE